MSAILSQDTKPEIEQKLVSLWQQMTPQKKAFLVGEACRAAAVRAWQGVKLRWPELDDTTAYRQWARLRSGQPLPLEVRPMSYDVDPYAITRPVLEALQAAGAQVVIVGSLASVIHGEIRLTWDGDLLTDLLLNQADRFVAAIRRDFYVDAQAVRDAVIRQGSFNVIHLDTAFKVDVFVPGPTPFARTQLQRAQLFEGIGPVATAEDTLLAKLVWFRQGGEVSDSQWRDVLALLLVNSSLDQDYLRHWSAGLGVTDLLQRAVDQASG